MTEVTVVTNSSPVEAVSTILLGRYSIYRNAKCESTDRMVGKDSIYRSVS